jgi:hypothetical protein
MNSKLKTELPHLIASVAMVPFLAAWPFLSAFPVFSLMEGSGMVFSTVLNIVFLATGFWSLAGGLWILSWLTDGRVQTVKSPHKMLVIGGYAATWTSLYTAYAMWPTL